MLYSTYQEQGDCTALQRLLQLCFIEASNEPSHYIFCGGMGLVLPQFLRTNNDVSTINIKVVVFSSEISGITNELATRFLTVVISSNLC